MSNTSATGGYIQPLTPPPISGDQLDGVMQALVVGVTGLPGNLVRPRWQSIEPKSPDLSVDWCGIGVIEYVAESNVSHTHSGVGLGSSTSYQVEKMVVSASFYGPNCRSNAALLRAGLMMAQNREALSLLEISLAGEPTAASRVPELVNGQWLDRADLQFAIVRREVWVWPIENVLGIVANVVTDADNQDDVITVP